jgi:L-cysteine desulfidase
MESVHYTRSTLNKDYFDFYNPTDELNVIELSDGTLVSPDNELLAEKKVVLDNFKLYQLSDTVNVNDIDKYFIEIAWYDSTYSHWLSAILIPSDWGDVLKAQEMSEGKQFVSPCKSVKYTQLKDLYPLSNTKNSSMIRFNVDDAKHSLQKSAEHIYVVRGLHSGILTKHKYDNMVHKNVLDDTSFIWVSAWKLVRNKIASSRPTHSFNHLV